ncbi:MAG TPA: hypothetical protein VM283_08495, partial [Armatimonadota bacterium]|nr:hypothetical protein [Armatimonadota bacterium]
IRAEGPLPAIAAANLSAVRVLHGGGPHAPGVPVEIATGVVEVRGSGVTAMNPDLEWYVRRGCQTMGYTLPERQVLDLLNGIELMRGLDHIGQIAVFGRGEAAVHAIYAALADEAIAEVVLEAPPVTHTDPATPELPSVLRVGDLPHNLALLFPRPITFVGEVPEAYQWTVDLYEKLGRADRIRVIEKIADWEPLP